MLCFLTSHRDFWNHLTKDQRHLCKIARPKLQTKVMNKWYVFPQRHLKYCQNDIWLRAGQHSILCTSNNYKYQRQIMWGKNLIFHINEHMIIDISSAANVALKKPMLFIPFDFGKIMHVFSWERSNNRLYKLIYYAYIFPKKISKFKP